MSRSHATISKLSQHQLLSWRIIIMAFTRNAFLSEKRKLLFWSIKYSFIGIQMSPFHPFLLLEHILRFKDIWRKRENWIASVEPCIPDSSTAHIYFTCDVLSSLNEGLLWNSSPWFVSSFSEDMIDLMVMAFEIIIELLIIIISLWTLF